MSSDETPETMLLRLNEEMKMLRIQNEDLMRRAERHHPASRGSPKVLLPEKFTGKHSEFRNFLAAIQNVLEIQEDRYNNDRVKTGLVGSLCAQDALNWYRTLQEERSELLYNYDLFLDAFKSQFGDPYLKRNAKNQVVAMNQGRSSASAYAARFKRVAADSGFNDETLRYHFEEGLRDDVKRAISVNDEDFDSLETLIRYAIKVDNRLFQFRSEQPGGTFLTPRISGPGHGPTPMDLGAVQARRTKQDRPPGTNQRGACWTCGSTEHQARQCPVSNRSASRVHFANYVSGIQIKDSEPKNEQGPVIGGDY